MRNRRLLKYLVILTLLVVSSVLLLRIFFDSERGIKVYFFDVGQGDVILVSQGSNQLLVDGGPSGEAILEKLGRTIPFWDRKIEVLVATHPDADHLSGLVDVLERYEVGLVVDSGMESDSQTFQRFEELLAEKNIRRETGREGMRIVLGQEAALQILSPTSDFQGGKTKDTNLESIVSRLDFGENSFLLMADAPEKKEAALIERGSDIQAKVLKVGHHGSKYSTGKDFLEKVSPREVILLVGAHNRYGHPSQETLERLEEARASVFRTDQSGDIIYDCPSLEESCRLR